MARRFGSPCLAVGSGLGGIQSGLLLLGFLATPAHAMCIAKLDAGFPHAHVRHYPANIRGVLFQAPDERLPSAQDFAITSADDQRRLRIRIEPVVLPPGSAAQHNLPRGTRLLRIMLEGGYLPGNSYRIGYTAPRSVSTYYPDAISFTIDRAAVALRPGDVALLLHRPAVRMHVVMKADTGVGLVAATRRLALRVPAALRSYQGAISFFPEWAHQDHGLSPAYTPLRQSATSCSGEDFGAGARDRPDVVYQVCDQPVRATTLRASVGLFEIDDRLHALPPTQVVWDDGVLAQCALALRRPLTRRQAREAMESGVLPGAVPVDQ